MIVQLTGALLQEGVKPFFLIELTVQVSSITNDIIKLKNTNLNFGGKFVFGAFEERCTEFVRKPNENDEKDSNWKPL